MSKIKTPEEFLEFQTEEIPNSESCFNGVRTVEWWDGNVEDDIIYSKEQMITFAKTYHEYASKLEREEKIKAIEDVISKLIPRKEYDPDYRDGLLRAIKILKK